MHQASLNHCEVVESGLAETKAVDEQTLTSVAVLEDRLKRLKKQNKAFKIVSFSPAVRKLAKQNKKISAV